MEVVIFCGIQASGKSSFYKENFFNSHMRISLDLLNTRNRESLFMNMCYQTTMSFVVDNTNPTEEERKKYIKLAKENQAKVIGYYFQSKIEDAIARNNQRQGKAYIPEIAIKGTFNKLEIPSFEEGFDELYYVQMKDNGFIINKWES